MDPKSNNVSRETSAANGNQKAEEKKAGSTKAGVGNSSGKKISRSFSKTETKNIARDSESRISQPNTKPAHRPENRGGQSNPKTVHRPENRSGEQSAKTVRKSEGRSGEQNAKTVRKSEGRSGEQNAKTVRKPEGKSSEPRAKAFRKPESRSSQTNTMETHKHESRNSKPNVSAENVSRETYEEPEDVFQVSYNDFKELFHVKHFQAQLHELGIEITDEQLKKFYLYYRELVKWNTVINLTAITELPDVLEKHFLDSLSIVKVIPQEKLNAGISLIDIGTGAGFPGIPLAIVFPKTKVVLMDSLNKRLNFLNRMIEELHLENARTVHARAEDLARQKNYREKFDVVCSRAVASLNVLSEYCIPFAGAGGEFVAYKSENADEEIRKAGRAVKVLGGEFRTAEKFLLPDTDYERVLICITKKKPTPPAYPRKAGTPSKDPII